MASAKNVVIKGNYSSASIFKGYGGAPYISYGGQNIILCKTTIESYEVITEEQRKSGTSAVLRAGAGAVLLGGVGLLAGLSAKNKGIYVVAIQFKDGKKSLIEIDDKIYKQLVQAMF